MSVFPLLKLHFLKRLWPNSSPHSKPIQTPATSAQSLLYSCRFISTTVSPMVQTWAVLPPWHGHQMLRSGLTSPSELFYFFHQATLVGSSTNAFPLTILLLWEEKHCVTWSARDRLRLSEGCQGTNERSVERIRGRTYNYDRQPPEAGSVWPLTPSLFYKLSVYLPTPARLLPLWNKVLQM